MRAGTPAVLAMTCGEPAGIGPELAARVWARRDASMPAFYLLSDPDLIVARAQRARIEINVRATTPEEAADIFPEALPVVPLENAQADTPGLADPASAPAVLESIERAVADTMAGRAAGLVTCPIAKKPLYDAGFAFPGHTEFLAHLVARATGTSPTPVMMLAGPQLRAVPVTIHVPLSEVPLKLSTSGIVETGRIVAADLAKYFGIARPRLAIAGLNPHAGEDGAMGGEEISVIAPAVRALRSAGIDAFGPLPADTMFHEAARAGYDAAICMYHDQALIPAKALAFDTAVNVTLGLPFVRTSPDHGTAFDIAGKGVARETSLAAALDMAARMAIAGSRGR
ncbi:MAG: 4-hydroxythreonine-4-phosphate dehydrogenase PdxA [Rhizobiaceae bacterium]|nr:4-hydroxythreonine-4-phosphate dehydrogenase PdxA [Rhizobiaceae bacterium]MCV0406453.1 4-hydroxythreonine-4-phosphate dehydrogenase PdxA [Rhizobiaceae bacterium]